MFQAEDGIRDLVRSRGLGDVYKRQAVDSPMSAKISASGLQSPLSGEDLEHSRFWDVGLSLIHI